MNISWSEIKPYENELPTNYADRIGRLYTDTVTAAFKKSNGQFFSHRYLSPILWVNK